MGQELQAIIRDEIADAGGVIPFVRFMELALYHPGYGYYMTDKPKVGKQGDFYTSPSVHPVFAETVADAVVDMLDHCSFERPVLVEAGAGPGSLLAAMLEEIRQKAPQWFELLQVVLIETSEYHRDLQRSALASFDGEKRWYPSVEAAAKHEAVTGVILSNEWFDALPVHLLDKQQHGWREVGVAWDPIGGRFVERYLPELTSMAEVYLSEKQPDLPNGARIEANPLAREVVEALSRMLVKGYVITIDYGDTDEGLYHPSRRDGTVMCYYRHRAHDNPLIHVGEQDITAHVNYSDLIRWGEAAGLLPVTLTSQEQFLLGSGILEKLMDHMDRDPFTSPAMRRNRAIQQLVSPGGMGGVFRVLVQRKDLSESIPLRFLAQRGSLPFEPNS
ncbi:SAM-dependent methyltransferase [Brevibacillus humidisoli]|uniref:class I SAM-dependent methyltransferase n=1 Tax=Brevibacillus humidisoli TaxID=2895522 RepID=UPI001E40FA76|nr:SAM-dependent methyltransferase [Brevibacillus humidisoli]UFJ41894.1 SAM-dependent methyltransferase [Brevibacillus humidisoli]